MDLWIRSQDKMALSKYDLLIVEKTPTGEYMFIADHYKNFGIYKSKERALEVLDEIQRNISDGKYDYIRSRFRIDGYVNDIDIPYQKTTVYKMPEE